MAKCLITGGSGFIGTHLVKGLKDKGHEVEIISRSNNTDFTDIKSVQKILKKRFDYVFHLASEGTRKDHKGEEELILTNVVATYKLINLFRNYSLKGFVCVGSSSEYGFYDKPMREEMALKPRFLFAGTKAATTMIAASMAYDYGLPIVSVRPFAVYGPGDYPDRFVPIIIKAALSKKVLKLYHGTHDWIYVKDVVRAMIELGMKAKKLKGEVFNIGSGIETSNEAVVRMVENIMGIKIRIKKMKSKLKSYDSTYWSADMTKLKSVIDWRPTRLKKGLEKTIDYFCC